MDISASSDSIKENVPNRFSLVVLAAKRAKQIREGSPVLINTQSTNWLTIALEEIAAGKVNYIDAPIIPDDEVPHKAATETRSAASVRQSVAMQMLNESLATADEPDSSEMLEDEDLEDEIDIDDGNNAEELVTTAISEE